MVLPDNCVFADQAGEVFKVLTELQPPHGAPPAAWHVHPVQPEREGERRLLHEGRTNTDGVDIRCPHQPAQHHQEGSPADGRDGEIQQVLKLLEAEANA